MNTDKRKVIEAIERNPNAAARQIAKETGVKRKEVEKILNNLQKQLTQARLAE